MRILKTKTSCNAIVKLTLDGKSVVYGIALGSYALRLIAVGMGKVGSGLVAKIESYLRSYLKKELEALALTSPSHTCHQRQL